MATAQHQNHGKNKQPQTRVAGATPPPKAPTPSPGQKEKEAEKAAKPAKPSKPVLDKVYGRASKLARSITKILGTVRQFEGQGSDEQKASSTVLITKLDGMGQDAQLVQEYLAKLKADGFAPTLSKPESTGGGGRAAKPELAPNVQVWIKPKKLAEYKGAFAEEALADLWCEKIIGTKALVRIGKEATEGKVAKMIGFVPKSHITTVKPV